MSVVKTNSNKRNLTTLLPAIYEFNRAVAAFPAAGIRGLPGFHPDPNDALAFLVQTVSLKRELTISNAYLEAKVDPDSWMPDIKFQTNFWSEGANQSIHDLYSGWLGALTNLAIEVRSVPDWMAAGCYGPALALYDRGRSNEVWGAVATALGIDEPGLRQLVAIRDAPPGKRMPVLQATVKPESSLTSLRAVWDRFGHAAHDWPEDEGSFQILVNLQETLWRKAGEFPRTACAEMPDLRAELLDEGPKLMTAIFRCFHEDAGIARELDRLRDKLLLKNIATRLSTRSEWQFNHHLLEQRRAVGLLAESPDPKLLAAGRDELMRRYGSLSGPSPFSQNKMVPIQNIDFSRPIVVNPNRTNWSVKPGRDGELNFELAGVRRSSVRVTFLLVQPPDIPAFYLATTEVSVGLVAAMTDRRYWQTNRAAYFLNWGGERDIRTGIVTWQLDEGNRFGPAARWADPHGPMAAWAERKDEVPSPDHPMTYVSPERARDLADRMGFRLPTLVEWQAAAALYPNSARNLFDQRVSNAVIVAMKNKDDAPWLPNQDSYIPRQVGKVTSHTDPWFFFSRVNEGGGAGDLFKHLIGNVWEITQSDLSSYSILGGSLFTDAPDLKVPPIPITPGATTRGYSDVGFRLAMDASPAEQYRHWLSQLAYAR